MSHPCLPLPTLRGQSKDILPESSLPAAGLPPLSPTGSHDGGSGSSSWRVKLACSSSKQWQHFPSHAELIELCLSVRELCQPWQKSCKRGVLGAIFWYRRFPGLAYGREDVVSSVW